jgi:hypothetical protein
MGDFMNIAMFMSKKDWVAIFSASCLLILLLLLALIGKGMIWGLIIFLFIMSCISFYLAFIKKYEVDDNELEDMLGDLKDTMFGSKKSKVKK